MALDTPADQAEADDAELRALVATMTNPQRIGIVHALAAKPGMGSGEIADSVDLPAPMVRKHLRALMETGMVEVKERAARRGVQKLYFVVSRYAWIKEDDSSSLSRRQRQTLDLGVLRRIIQDARKAIALPEYGARAGRMVASLPATVDGRAWKEISELQHELLDRMIEIAEAGNRRLAEGSEEPIPITTALLLLELPGQAEEGESSTAPAGSSSDPARRRD